MEAQINDLIRSVGTWTRQVTIKARDTVSDEDWSNVNVLWVKTQVLVGDNLAALGKALRVRS